VVRVHHAKQSFEQRGAQVLVIAFQESGLEAWAQQADIGFPILVDKNRQVYRAYGLRRSIWGSWHPRNLLFYAKRFLRGESIPRVRADPNQLGGDFLISQSGRLGWRHPAQDALDRPEVGEVLAALDEMLGSGGQTS
jgi:hypothetical protein